MTESFPPPGYISSQSVIDGIEVYLPAPLEKEIQEQVVDFSCPQCGATTAFSVEDGGLTCSHCGYYEAPPKEVVGKGAQEFEFTVETLERSAHGWGGDRNEIACQNCGAVTSVPIESLTHTCAFCGSNKVIQRQAIRDILRPRFLIPFKIEAMDCREIARGWLGKSWMVPSKLQNIADHTNFTGVFLPFWTFDSKTEADWKAEVGHTKTKRYYSNGKWKTQTVTEWRWESGHVEENYDDLLVEGTNRVSHLLLDSIKDFNLEALVPFEPKFLAGLQAKAYEVPLERGWEISRQQMREHTRQVCRAQASTPKIRNFSMHMDYSDESWRYILLPVYLATYNYADKVYQVMVNAQTGAIAGQRPVDWTKVWLVFAALLAPGVLLGLIGLITIPFGGIGAAFGFLGFLLLVIGVVTGIVILRKAFKFDDE